MVPGVSRDSARNTTTSTASMHTRGRRHRLSGLAVVTAIVGSLTAIAVIGGFGGSASPALASVPSGCVLNTNGNGFGALSGGGVSPSLGLPGAIDTAKKSIMLFVDFPDALAGAETATSLYNLLVPAAKAWMQDVSYHRFDIAVDVMGAPGPPPWLHMSHNVATYGLGDLITANEQRVYMTEAVSLAEAQGVNFAGYEEVYVVPSSTSGTAISYSPAFIGGSNFPIVTPNGAHIPAGATFGNDIHAPGLTNYGAWIMAHETMHSLGLPDLYSFANLASYPLTHQFSGSWDHMDAIVRGNHITAWQKAQLGWLDASQVACVTGPGGSFVLTSLEHTGGLKAIAIKTGPTTAIVAENRQQIDHDGPGFGGGLCDHGLLVYSVDASVASGSGPVRVFPSGPEDTASPNYGDTACGPLWNAAYDTRPGKNDTFTYAPANLTIKVTNSVVGGDITVSVTLPTPPTTTTTTTAPTSTTTPEGGSDSTFVAVQPERLLDTRDGAGQIGYSGPKPVADQTIALKVTGVGVAQVPATAAAVALNVTGIDASNDGFVTVYPCGSPRPTASNLNLVRGATAPNMVITKIGSGGNVCLYTQNGADLAVDISGYFTAGTSFVSVQPERLLETRAAVGQIGYSGAKPAAGATVHLQVVGAGATNVPNTARSVVLNITAVGATGDGFVTAWPCDQPRPNASNLNLVAGATAPNLTVVKLAADGSVCLFTQSGADLLADISAYFTNASSYTPITPVRLLDTRPPGTGYTGAKPAAGETVTVVAVDSAIVANVGAVVLNVTGIDATADGFVTAWPCGTPRPTASNLNLVGGATTPNLVIVRVGAAASVCLFTQSGAHLAADISGSFPPTS